MQYSPTLHKLSNGLTVILDPMDIVTTSVEIRFITGARDEKPGEQGLTHFCEHVLCKGTKRFPTERMIKEHIEYNGGIWNASTGNGLLNFYGRILAENTNVLIDLFADQIQNSLFLPEKINIERGVVTDELRRSLDDSFGQLRDFTNKTLFGDAAYGPSKVLGTFENINSFTRDQIVELLSRRLSSKNCVIAISGKISDVDAMLKYLEKTFAFLPSHDVSKNDSIKYTQAVAHNSKPDKKNIMLRIYFPELWENKYENKFREKCFSRFSRFMVDGLREVVRQENGLVYGFGAAGAGTTKLGLDGVATETSADNLEKCVALIANHSHKIYTENKITDEDLDRYNRLNKLGDADFLEDAGDRRDALMNFYCDFGLVYDYYDNIKIRESVKRDDVIENSRGFFDGPMSIITQGVDHNLDLRAIWEDNFK
ncbi:MAG: insulinase family protein [Alphaproteobacteria bacterium]|nr:insulinase family protein [Alphaproteobacteria bacterium]